MRLLVSNDDGIFAQGIHALASALADAGHEITVVCPDRERSATGHGLTLHKPIRAERIDTIFDPSIRAWACSGTPSDCVKLALGALLERPPDLVVSGINHGQNLGTDILYSGTVSAAMEGVIEGIPSIAFSLASYTSKRFEVAADFARILLDRVKERPFGEGILLNVNIPAVERQEIAGVTLATQGVRRYKDLFEERIDPRGNTYYWLAGEAFEEGADSNATHLPDDLPSDLQAIRENYITLTPLQCNLTCVRGLSSLRTWGLQLPQNW